jgi:hypothetical protein
MSMMKVDSDDDFSENIPAKKVNHHYIKTNQSD